MYVLLNLTELELTAMQELVQAGKSALTNEGRIPDDNLAKLVCYLENRLEPVATDEHIVTEYPDSNVVKLENANGDGVFDVTKGKGLVTFTACDDSWFSVSTSNQVAVNTLCKLIEFIEE